MFLSFFLHKAGRKVLYFLPGKLISKVINVTYLHCDTAVSFRTDRGNDNGLCLPKLLFAKLFTTRVNNTRVKKYRKVSQARRYRQNKGIKTQCYHPLHKEFFPNAIGFGLISPS